MNNTIYNNDGTLKRHFFRGAEGGLRTMRKQLLAWQARYATLMHLDTTVAGLLDEIGIMLRVVEQLERDQDDKAKVHKEQDKAFAAKMPPKRSKFEKLRAEAKAKKALDEAAKNNA